jgi:hypothetical protein
MAQLIFIKYDPNNPYVDGSIQSLLDYKRKRKAATNVSRRTRENVHSAKKNTKKQS